MLQTTMPEHATTVYKTVVAADLFIKVAPCD